MGPERHYVAERGRSEVSVEERVMVSDETREGFLEEEAFGAGP